MCLTLSDIVELGRVPSNGSSAGCPVQTSLAGCHTQASLAGGRAPASLASGVGLAAVSSPERSSYVSVVILSVARTALGRVAISQLKDPGVPHSSLFCLSGCLDL